MERSPVTSRDEVAVVGELLATVTTRPECAKDAQLRSLLLTMRQTRVMEIRAIEDYLGLGVPRSERQGQRRETAGVNSPENGRT